VDSAEFETERVFEDGELTEAERPEWMEKIHQATAPISKYFDDSDDDDNDDGGGDGDDDGDNGDDDDNDGDGNTHFCLSSE
jgi:hypothetical protein